MDLVEKLIEPAKLMFEAYNEQGPNPWKTWDGKDVPRWDQVNDQVRAKWRAAAEAAADARFMKDISRPVDPIFGVHMLTEEGKKKAVGIAAAFNILLADLTVLVPEGRELSIVKTKLEEACFFAKKGMAKSNCE